MALLPAAQLNAPRGGGDVAAPLLRKDDADYLACALLVVAVVDTDQTALFPLSSALRSSHVLRKLGVVERLCLLGVTTQALVVRNASPALGRAVALASTLPQCSIDVDEWLDVHEFLGVERLCPDFAALVCTQALRQPLGVRFQDVREPGALRARGDALLVRQVLTESVSRIQDVSPAMQEDIASAGGDTYPVDTVKEDALLPPAEVEQARVIFTTRALPPRLIEVLARLINASVLHSYGCRSAHRNLEIQTLNVARHMCRTAAGCLAVLRDLMPLIALEGDPEALFHPHTGRELAREALRSLYKRESAWAEDVAAPDGPFVPLGTIRMIRSLWLSRPSLSPELALLLPLDPQVIAKSYLLPQLICARCRPLPMDVELPIGPEQVRAELVRRAPFLRALGAAASPLDFCVTGSLLTESIVRPGIDLRPSAVGDVDIFCSTREDCARLATLALALFREMYGSAEVLSSKETKTTILVAGATTSQFSADIYVNSLATLRNYYLSHLRAAFSWQQGRVWLLPSAAVALATGVDVDVKWGPQQKKDIFALLAKKWRSGFSLLMNSKELCQFRLYLCDTSLSADERAELRRHRYLATAWTNGPPRGRGWIPLGALSLIEEDYLDPGWAGIGW